MPEVVKTHLRKTGALQQWLELECRDGAARLSRGSPISEANIRPFSLHRDPTLSISASWRSRWLLRASMALPVSFTLRLEPAVFGAVKTGPSLVMVSVRRTWREPFSRSTSSHFRPSSSPWRRPVCIATLAKATARDLLLGTIGDPEKAEEVVQGLMDAPLKPTPSGYYESGALTYVIVFHLKDGTAVLRDYRTDTGRLDNNISGWGGGGYPQPLRSIVTPQAFREAVEEEGYTEAPPDSTLSYGGREVKSSESLVHSWEYSGDVYRAMIDDLLTTPPRKEMLTVPSGSKMLFRYETQGPPNKVSATGYPLIADKNRPPGDPQGWGPGRSLKAYGSGVERTIPVELQPRRPGYAIVVTVKEPQGKVSYAFRVMVE